MTEKCLKIFGVEVRFRSGGASNGYKVRVKLGETLKRIKRHITESLDIQGRLAYKEFNFDDHPTKRLSEVYKEGDETFCLATEKKPRDLKHQVQLKLPNSMTGVVKIARTTTIANLKHKIQDEYGILVDEQAIYVPSQQKECQQDTNVMLLSSPLLEVRLVRKEAMQKKPPQALKFRTPYDTKQSACVSKRKIYDSSPIHPKTFKGKEKSVQKEEVQTEATVNIQQAPFEALHQLGTNMEQLQNDKTKKLIVEVEHSNDKITVTSKLVPSSGDTVKSC